MRRLAWACLLAALLAACSTPVRPGPTPVPEPPEVQLLPGRGVQVTGHGTSQTDPITPQYDSGLNVGIMVVSISHDGHASFIVSTDQDGQAETLLSVIGAYSGQRPLVVEGPVAFRVNADGNWSLKLQPVPQGGTPNFSGSGDGVSGYFSPPAPGVWTVTHDGQSGFYAYAHCLGGSVLVEDTSGAVHATPR